jgi:hypothetical protein
MTFAGVSTWDGFGRQKVRFNKSAGLFQKWMQKWPSSDD